MGKLSGMLVSDFTIDALATCLANEAKDLYHLNIAPFGQPMHSLRNLAGDASQSFDFAVIWTQPASVIPSFQKLVQFESVAQDEILAECLQWIKAIEGAAARCRCVFVVSWPWPAYDRGAGPVDWQPNGCRYRLAELNMLMMQKLAALPNVYVLNADAWLQMAGEKACDPRLWYAAKMPFDGAVLRAAARDITAALRASLGQSRKLIILDLDNVLWGGVAGDEGWENLRLGGHDPQGEAFVDFQRALKGLSRRGILLAIASKNQEQTAWEVFGQHPEMVLRKTDFAAWRINWQDKALNVSELLDELNLKPEAAVFIDDHPVERARVQEAIPAVLVPAWPQNPLLYRKALLSLTCFDSVHISGDDMRRGQMYVQNQERNALKLQAQSLEEWLGALATTVTIEGLGPRHLSRAVQLLNKTNQMNLTTRRVTEPELSAWLGQANHKIWVFSVEDKIGNSGLTGLASFAVDQERGTIVDFVLSCRVFGRQIEDLMLETLIREARRLGLCLLQARYLPTAKNQPCLEFLRRSGLTQVADHVFQSDLSCDNARPQHLTVKETQSSSL